MFTRELCNKLQTIRSNSNSSEVEFVIEINNETESKIWLNNINLTRFTGTNVV